MIPDKLLPMLILFATACLIITMRRLRVVLADRRDRREAAEQAEYARITGWIKKLQTENVGPAVTRDARGKLVLFMGLRAYANTGRKFRKSRGV